MLPTCLLVACLLAGAPRGMDAIQFWGRAADEAALAPPGFHVTQGSVEFPGPKGQSYRATVSVAEWSVMAFVHLVAGGLPTAPREKHASHLVVRWMDGAWTSQGLPQADAYCVRRAAVAAVRGIETLRELAGLPGRRMVLVAHGWAAPAALGLAAARPDMVSGVLLVEPTPWVHMQAGRVALVGPEGDELERLLRRHPEWVGVMERSLSLYDIARLGRFVACPVGIVFRPENGEAWYGWASRAFGWRCVELQPGPGAVDALYARGDFLALWTMFTRRRIALVPLAGRQPQR